MGENKEEGKSIFTQRLTGFLMQRGIVPAAMKMD